MQHLLISSICFLLLAACGPVDGSDADPEVDVNANADGDCMTDLEEEELGTRNPDSVLGTWKPDLDQVLSSLPGC